MTVSDSELDRIDRTGGTDISANDVLDLVGEVRRARTSARTTMEILQELLDRATRAATTLDRLSSTDDEMDSSRRKGKAEGVAVLTSYIEEAIAHERQR
jgi:hypothetical protein